MKPGPKVDPAKVETAKAMYLTDATLREIAAALGVSDTTVCSYVRDLPRRGRGWRRGRVRKVPPAP